MNETAVTFNTKAARAMRSAYEGEKDGALICEAADAKRLIFFERGYLVGAKSDRVDERLGEIIVTEGRITRAQLEESTRFIRSGRKLGRILMELGFLKVGEIETYVRLQIIRIASSMLISTPERMVFSEGVPVEAVTLSPVSIGDVFLEAASYLTDIDLYRENVLIDDYVLGQTADALALAGSMKLSAEEARVLDLVNETNAVGEILSASELSSDRTLRLLVALHQAGVVALKEKREEKVESPQAPEPPQKQPIMEPGETELIDFFNDMQCQNHWQVLGLGRNATHAEIDLAYRTIRGRFNPEQYQHIADTDFHEKLSSVRARLLEAFLTLSSKTSTNIYDRLVGQETQYEEKKQTWETISSTPPEPEAWDRPKNTEEAKGLFAKAKRAYKEQDFWRAIELCRASIELSDENDPERFYFLGKALSENPRWRQDAEKNLKLAHNLSPWEPKYLVALGKFYEKVGLQHRAQRFYEQVRAMDPDYQITDDVDVKKGKNDASEDPEVI